MDMKFSHKRINGIRLHVAEAGPPDGPLVVLLHGFPEFWFGWRHQIGPLVEAGFHVVVPDQCGYGHSDKPEGLAAYELDRLAADVLSLAAEYGRERFRVVGHDWGASVGWWLATAHAERIERLVAMNAPHPSVWYEAMTRDPVQRRRSWYLRLFRLPWLPEWLLSRGDFRALRKGFEDARPGAFTAEDFGRYRRAWSQRGALHGMLNWYRAFLRNPPGPSSGVRIAPPTLILWGERDRYAGRELAQASAALCERAEVVWFGKATHWIQHDEPAAVARLCVSFLAA